MFLGNDLESFFYFKESKEPPGEGVLWDILVSISMKKWSEGCVLTDRWEERPEKSHIFSCRSIHISVVKWLTPGKAKFHNSEDIAEWNVSSRDDRDCAPNKGSYGARKEWQCLLTMEKFSILVSWLFTHCYIYYNCAGCELLYFSYFCLIDKT